MALLSEIKDGILLIRSVGDHGLEEGLQQMDQAMQKVEQEFNKTGVKVHMFFDMEESEEAKSPDELRQIIQYFQSKLQFLSGKMAIYVKEKLHFGLSKVFEAYGEIKGIDAHPGYEKDKLMKWLNSEL